MSIVIDFRVMDAHQHDSRLLEDGSISIVGSSLDPETKARAWLAENVSAAPRLDGVMARVVKG